MSWVKDTLTSIFPEPRHWLLLPMCALSGLTGNCGPEPHARLMSGQTKVEIKEKLTEVDKLLAPPDLRCQRFM